LTLEALVELDGAQPPGRVVHILQQMCGALAEAHAVAFIHRDIKPANVVLCERGGESDVVKVLDFGLVKRRESAGDVKLSGERRVVGTPALHGSRGRCSRPTPSTGAPISTRSARSAITCSAASIVFGGASVAAVLADTCTPRRRPSPDAWAARCRRRSRRCFCVA
jgi:serine/threonine protein kinase